MAYQTSNPAQRIVQAGQQVFRFPRYVVTAVLLAVAAFLFAVWLPNLGLIGEVFTNSSAPLGDKLRLAFTLLGSIRTNFSFLSATYTILIALLFGINIESVSVSFGDKTVLRVLKVITASRACSKAKFLD